MLVSVLDIEIRVFKQKGIIIMKKNIEICEKVGNSYQEHKHEPVWWAHVFLVLHCSCFTRLPSFSTLMLVYRSQIDWKLKVKVNLYSYTTNTHSKCYTQFYVLY